MNSLTIAVREFSGYFRRPVAYVVVTAFLVLCGTYTFFLHPFFVVGRATLVPFFEFVPFLFTLFIPAITMRAIADERRSGMIEILQTWPVGDGQLILGKYLGAVGLIISALALTVSFPVSIALMGPLDWGAVTGGYLGLILLASTYTALGVLASSLTSNQIVSFILGFLFCFFFFVVGRSAAYLPAELGFWAEFLGFERRITALAGGVLDVRDLVYFGTVIAVALGLSAERLNSRRWR